MQKDKAFRTSHPSPASPSDCAENGPLNSGEEFARWKNRVNQMRDDGSIPPDAPAMRCRPCGSPRTGDRCHKCGGDLVPGHPDWVEPAIPDIDRMRALAREVGYALGVHGSLERDVDLIAAPWTDEAIPAKALAEHIATGMNGSVIAASDKPLGRWSCNIQIDGWFKLIDLSVAPRGIGQSDPLSKAIAASDRSSQRFLDELTARLVPAESSLSGAQGTELTRSARDEPFSPPPSDHVGGEG